MYNFVSLLLNTINFYSPYTLTGLLDSDGTVTIRPTLRNDNKLGFSVLVSYTQQTSNVDVLETIKVQLGSTNKIVGFENNQAKSRFDVFFDSPPGDKLLPILLNHLPFSPGKRRDFRIACKIFEYCKNNYMLPEVQKLSGFTSEQKERISSIVCVYLYDRTTESTDSRRKDKSEYLNHLEASKEELQLGEKLANELTVLIEKDVANLIHDLQDQNKKLPRDYIVGFHIGDGCLGITYTFSNSTVGNLKLIINIFWYLDEKTNSQELLTAFRNTLGEGLITGESMGRVRYKVSSVTGCMKTVLPTLEGVWLPKARKMQYEKFKTCLLILLDGFHMSPDGFETILDVGYDMNGGDQRKKTKESISKRAVEYFNQSHIKNMDFDKHLAKCRKRFDELDKHLAKLS